jgi:error-prone DNA polymerase
VTPEGGGRFAVRLGLRQIKGLSEVTAARVMAARLKRGRFYQRGGSRPARPAAARGSGPAGVRRRLWLAEHPRREAGWRALGLSGPDLPLFEAAGGERRSVPDLSGARLPQMALSEEVARDYVHLSLSLKAHPMHFLRERFFQLWAIGRARELLTAKNGARFGLGGAGAGAPAAGFGQRRHLRDAGG